MQHIDEYEKEVGHQRLHIILFHLCKVSRKGKLGNKTKTDQWKFRVWGVGGRWLLSAKGNEGA